jgi:hypothetical protein
MRRHKSVVHRYRPPGVPSTWEKAHRIVDDGTHALVSRASARDDALSFPGGHDGYSEQMRASLISGSGSMSLCGDFYERYQYPY